MAWLFHPWKRERSPAFPASRSLLPAMEQADAKKLGAAAATLPTRHLAMLEDPEKVAAVIDQAAKQVLSK